MTIQCFSVALLSLALLASCASTSDGLQDGQQPGSVSESDYKADIASLLETFDGIIITGPQDNQLSRAYMQIRPLLAAGEIRVQADFQPPNDPFIRGRFTMDSQKGTPVLLINHELLDMASENPVPALSAYAGLIAHLQDYSEYRQDIGELYSDPLEYYLAQMDALFLQGVFIRDYALELYGEQSFTDMEYYFLQSLEVDGFSSHSLFVWGIDKDIVYSMLGLSTQYAHDEVSAAEYSQKVLALGRDIRDNFALSRQLLRENQSDTGDGQSSDDAIARRTLYIAATSANSYRTLGSLIFSTMVADGFSDDDYAQLGDQLSEINELYALLGSLLEELGEFPREYRKEYLETF